MSLTILFLCVALASATCPEYGSTNWAAGWTFQPSNLIQDGRLVCNSSVCTATLPMTWSGISRMVIQLECQTDLAAAFSIQVLIGDSNAASFDSVALLPAELNTTWLRSWYTLFYRGSIKQQLQLEIRSLVDGAQLEIDSLQVLNCTSNYLWLLALLMLIPIGVSVVAFWVCICWKRRRSIMQPAEKPSKTEATPLLTSTRVN